MSLAKPTIKGDRPTFWLIAGPNGSGKSTIYRDLDIEESTRSVWIINPDVLAARIQDVEKVSLRDANLSAVKRIESWLDASIHAYQTIGVETVLSTPKYRRLVGVARERGFEIRLIYVLLDSVEHNIERVRIRVRKGGHRVPKDKIRTRHARSLDQFPWFLEHSDRAWIFDNSSSEPKLIGTKDGASLTHSKDALPEIVRAFGSVKAKR